MQARSGGRPAGGIRRLAIRCRPRGGVRRPLLPPGQLCRQDTTAELARCSRPTERDGMSSDQSARSSGRALDPGGQVWPCRVRNFRSRNPLGKGWAGPATSHPGRMGRGQGLGRCRQATVRKDSRAGLDWAGPGTSRSARARHWTFSGASAEQLSDEAASEDRQPRRHPVLSRPACASGWAPVPHPAYGISLGLTLRPRGPAAPRPALAPRPRFGPRGPAPASAAPYWPPRPRSGPRGPC